MFMISQRIGKSHQNMTACHVPSKSKNTRRSCVSRILVTTGIINLHLPWQCAVRVEQLLNIFQCCPHFGNPWRQVLGPLGPLAAWLPILQTGTPTDSKMFSIYHARVNISDALDTIGDCSQDFMKDFAWTKCELITSFKSSWTYSNIHMITCSMCSRACGSQRQFASKRRCQKWCPSHGDIILVLPGSRWAPVSVWSVTSAQFNLCQQKNWMQMLEAVHPASVFPLRLANFSDCPIFVLWNCACATYAGVVIPSPTTLLGPPFLKLPR